MTNQISTNQELTALFARVRAAQEKFSTYTQEQVDKIFLAAATAANKARIQLAKQAVEETGMGIVEDKVIKNTMLPNTSITPTSTKRPAAFWKRIPPSVS